MYGVPVENQEGRYAYRLPRRGGGELFLLLFDPASLSSYEVGGSLSEEEVDFTLEGLTGSVATVIDAIPDAESGADVVEGEPVFPEATHTIEGGSLTLRVGPRPVWVLTDPI